MQSEGDLGQWLKERCLKERLSLRKASEKTGISHTTIGLIINGSHAALDTIHKLAVAFGGDGDRQGRALEDELLTLAGYRTAPAKEDKTGEPLAPLMDVLAGLSEPSLKLMLRLAELLIEVER